MFSSCSEFAFPIEEVFGYHAKPGAIDRLIPPWESVRLIRRGNSLEVGTEVILQQSIGPLKLEWLARHTQWDPPHFFQDTQVKGPFSEWQHDHRFTSLSEHSTRLCDEVSYQLPFGALGRLASNFVQRKLVSMFDYRHRTTRQDLEFQHHLRLRRPETSAFRIAVSGASGLVGRRVCALASVLGMQVVRITRPLSDQKSEAVVHHAVSSLGPNGFLDPDVMEGLDAVIHLGGVGIADSRWTTHTKNKILESRTMGTRRLVESLSRLSRPPQKFVCASGIGAYGDRGDEICDDLRPIQEKSSNRLFLQKVSDAWEFEANAYSRFGTTCIGRLGIVLHPLSGALSKMLLPFRIGLGGRVGSGRQYWSWIHIDDAASALLHLALNPPSHGVYNICAPSSSTNRDFAKSLAGVLNRPCLLPAPAWGLRLGLGQMADELLLASTRAVPNRLILEGFKFRSPKLEIALRQLLGRIPTT